MNRAEAISRLNETFDVAIIGGGATGLGAAVDAAARGYRTVLLEASDFAKGTSSRSTKLVHGGVRYLAQGNVGLVREALRERGRLRRNAPHVVVDLPFVVPAYDFWSGPYFGLGLKLYDVLAGKQRLGKSRALSREEVLERIPTARTDGLRGGILYFDGQFDDTRLAMTLALTAWNDGAVMVNYAPVVRLMKKGTQICGVVARDLETGREHQIRARVVINATGVFADTVRRMDIPDASTSVLPSSGAHLVLPQRYLPGTNALIIPRTEDGRVVFLIPWKGRVLVGTTDVPVEKAVEEPRPTEQELDMLVRHAAPYLSLPLTRDDAMSWFAGLRPLVKPPGAPGETRDVTRDHSLTVSTNGLITIIGGKWTTYRKMAEDVIDEAARVGQLEVHECPTAEKRLYGAPETEGPPADPLDPFAVYGTEQQALRHLASADPSLGARVHPNLNVLGVQVVWAARKEMARTLEDVLSRRTRALYLDAAAAEAAAPRVAQLLAQELGKDEQWQAQQIAAFTRLCQQSRPLAGPPLPDAQATPELRKDAS